MQICPVFAGLVTNTVYKIHEPELFDYHFDLHLQDDVEAWLKSLKLGQYNELFSSEGYCTKEDVENLKGLTREDLQSIGITRRGKN